MTTLADHLKAHEGPDGDGKNVQGETVKKLDAWSNDIVVDALRASGRVATMVSEEMDEPVRVAATGAYTLSHSKVRMPPRGKVYSTNEGNTSKWEPGVKRWVEHLKASDAATHRPYSARYVGSFVADMHRTLLEGGIYCYPAETAADPQSVGKLRLQYEAAPMAMIAEQAGGRATTGRERILDIKPSTHHQRVPLFIGSADDVALAEEFIAGRR